MKRIFFFAALIGLSAWALTSCKQNDEPIPESFPRKHLIEEFTGQTCGYCPDGMTCVHDFMGDESNWVLILHHYGYQEDNFSVSGSKSITSSLGVSGAPSVTVDRAKTTVTEDGKEYNELVFHPYYLGTAPKSQFATTTYASIVLDNSYDASTRQLTVRVSGALARTDAPQLQLTVLIKESGMIDYQADYNNTFEGWEEFRHANAVRAFLSAPKGDIVEVKDQRYTASYTYKLKENWVPENCMVVAFLCEAFKPVVQAEQQPVVEGSKGGADILHGGIKEVPVPDYYPEPDGEHGPGYYTNQEADTMLVSSAWYTQSANYTLWNIEAYNDQDLVTYSKNKCLPFTLLYLLTEPGSTTIPAGTYEVSQAGIPGVVWPGRLYEETHGVGGSRFFFISKKYFNQGYFYSLASWFIVDGTMTVTEDGWELTGHTRNGSDLHIVGSTPIENKGESSAPGRKTYKKVMTCE